MTPKPKVLTCEDGYGNKITIELHWDIDVDAVVRAYQVITKFLTFHEDSYRENLRTNEEVMEQLDQLTVEIRNSLIDEQNITQTASNNE